jgi:prepilin-type N-terminal cleavage/methylation domain-containing protein
MFVKNGFTLVEVLVVVAIIGMLSLVVLPQLGESRAKGRDTARISDLNQLSVALRLYAEQHGGYPDHASGITVGEGDAIDSEIEPYMDVPQDPVSDVDHAYIYDSSYTCPIAGGTKAVIYATAMERDGNGNWNTVCGSSEPETRYGVILR